MLRRIGAMTVGVAAAVQPLLALAEDAKASEAVSRALGAPAGIGGVVLVTVCALLGLFAVAGLGFLYRRERRLDWVFQRPDAPPEAHH